MISREDYGYYDAPKGQDDIDAEEEYREGKEYRDELEADERRLREGEQY